MPDTVFRALVENAPDAIVVSRNGVVLYANPAAARLLGHDDVTEMIGKPMTFLDRTSAEVMMRRLQQMAETGERLVPREYPARRRDGVTITAEIASTFIDFDGAPAVLAYARDVTDRKRLQSQLAHADRLAALGTMAAGVAHEINNPLSFIGLATEMLAKQTGQAGPPDPSLLGELKRGVDRIATIVRELRFFGRDDSEVAGPVDLRAAIDAAAHLVAHEITPRGKLLKDVPELPAVMGIGRRFEQVFVNLLLNAAHSLPEGGGPDGRIAVRARVTDQHVFVTVVDNGRGIPPEDLALVFDPFFTTRAAGGGTGLGLSICRDIVVRAGGELVATSRVGEGTTMTLTLPRATSRHADDAVVARAAPASQVPVPATNLRVLVVDDEPVIVRLVGKCLESLATVVGETDPHHALKRLLSEPFDVVVCDVMMPGMTGIDLHERVATEKPDCAARFVFTTGGTYTARAHDYLERVPNVRLDKPFNSARLVEAVMAVAGSAAGGAGRGGAATANANANATAKPPG